jgi:hypothetical protein
MSYPEWVGAVSYAGIGRDGSGLSTSDWLFRRLTDGQKDCSFDDVAEKIRAAGTLWLQNILPAHRHHTFIFASIVKGNPRVAMISNFQSAAGAQSDSA